MEDKDYARSRKDNLCDDSFFQEMKIINITFPSDPLFSKLNGRKFFNGLENYGVPVVRLLKWKKQPQVDFIKVKIANRGSKQMFRTSLFSFPCFSYLLISFF